jgi:hypothetical protein
MLDACVSGVELQPKSNNDDAIIGRDLKIK